MFTQVPLFSPRRSIKYAPELRKSLKTTKRSWVLVPVGFPPFRSLSSTSSFLSLSFSSSQSFLLQVEIQTGRQNKNKKKGRKKKKEKSNDTHKRLFGRDERNSLYSLSGCNNIQGTESFKNDFLIHVICVCVEKR